MPSTSNHHFLPVQFGSSNVFLAPPPYLTHRPHSAPANPQLINQNKNSLTLPSRSHPAIVKPIAILPKTATNVVTHNRELCRSMPNTPTSLSTCPYSLFAPQQRNTNANSHLSARLNLDSRTPVPRSYVIVPNNGHASHQLRSNSMSSQNKPNRSVSVMPHSISYTPHSISYSNQSNMQLAINNLNEAYAVSQSISLPSHSRHGHGNAPQSIPNISHSIANMPHSIANMSHSTANMLHSGPNLHHSVANMPHCVANMQYPGGNFSHSMGNMPHSMANVPHSISVTSRMLPSQSFSVTSLSLPENSNYHRVTDLRKHRAVQMAKRLFLCKTKRKLVD